MCVSMIALFIVMGTEQHLFSGIIYILYPTPFYKIQLHVDDYRFSRESRYFQYFYWYYKAYFPIHKVALSSNDSDGHISKMQSNPTNSLGLHNLTHITIGGIEKIGKRLIIINQIYRFLIIVSLPANACQSQNCKPLQSQY